MSEFLQILIYGLVFSNIVVVLGFGTSGLTVEKKSFGVLIATVFSTIVTIIVVGILYYLIEKFVLVPFELEYLKLFIVVLLSYIIVLIMRAIIKLLSEEYLYIYEKSYGIAFQIVLSVGVLLITNFSGEFLTVLYYLLAYSIGYLLTQFIFFGLYEKIDNTKNLKAARNTPLMLYIVAVFSIILSAVAMLI